MGHAKYKSPHEIVHDQSEDASDLWQRPCHIQFLALLHVVGERLIGAVDAVHDVQVDDWGDHGHDAEDHDEAAPCDNACAQ